MKNNLHRIYYRYSRVTDKVSTCLPYWIVKENAKSGGSGRIVMLHVLF